MASQTSQSKEVIAIELLIYAALLYVAYEAIKWLIACAAPAAKWAALLLAAAGLVTGAIAAVKGYVQSIAHNINPYKYYVDRSPRRQEFARRRSYFFGPGYVQLGRTIRDAWRNIGRSMESAARFRRGMTDLVDGILILHQIVWLLSWLFYLCAAMSVGAVGSAITLILSAVHAGILIAFMLVIYALFSVVWLADRAYLYLRSIRTSCPVDQYRAVLPAFACPSCGRKHTRLAPGSYGIWHRRCVCGKKLPTTAFMGRSALTAYCPKCGSRLAAAGAKQFALTLVGGTSSGKTVLLSAFYHELFSLIRTNRHVQCEIPDICKSKFRDLEQWFSGAECGATPVSRTADMYSVLLHAGVFDVCRQFSIYDIFGEAFSDSEMTGVLPQRQMRDSDGALIVVDPLSAPTLLEDARREGDDTGNPSKANPAEVAANFVAYLKSVLNGGALSVKSQKPVAVVITKSDLSSIGRHISYPRIREIMNGSPDAFDSFDEARDCICREFLQDIGLGDAVKAVEAGFSEVHYFPVSAMGHPANGEAYVPEHVAEPFYWLIAKTQPALAELLNIPAE